MSRTTTRLLVLGLSLASPATAWAYSGLGCPDLPEYDRAVGALQGMPGACDMSIEKAKRIVAEHDGANAGVPRETGPHAARRQSAPTQP